MHLQNDTLRQITKFLGLFAAGIAGAFDHNPIVAEIASAVALASLPLTQSGFTSADWLMAGQKLAAQLCTALAAYLLPTQPSVSALLGVLAGALTGITVPRPGTAAKLEAVARASLSAAPRVRTN